MMLRQLHSFSICRMYEAIDCESRRITDYTGHLHGNVRSFAWVASLSSGGVVGIVAIAFLVMRSLLMGGFVDLGFLDEGYVGGSRGLINIHFGV
ncbi:hypothetical protein BDV32DRAFT_133531 [Aspergillus pseudonomiae]|nr:hypothetical protein BDV32DRAFT_133531 [Aspergillus pseudonomiae]